MAAGLAGSNFIYGAGMLECGMCVDLGQMMLDSDIISMVKFFLQGEEVTEETLDLNEIHKVGPGGNFWTAPSTKKRMRSQSRPKFFDRLTLENWKKKGSLDPYQVALEKAKEVLTTHKAEPMSDSLSQDIRKFIEETEKEWGIKSINPDFNPAQGFLKK